MNADRAAEVGQVLGKGAAEAATCAGDQGDLASEPLCHGGCCWPVSRSRLGSTEIDREPGVKLWRWAS